MRFNRLVRGLASICMGFKRYHLKTHTNSNESSNKSLKTHAFCKPEHTSVQDFLLKPMCITAKDTPRLKENHLKVLKTHVYSSNYTQNIPTEEQQEAENFLFAAPASGSISHAPAQLRLATHERIEIEIEINFPVTGGRINRTSSPLTSDIYIYIYIFISIQCIYYIAAAAYVL